MNNQKNSTCTFNGHENKPVQYFCLDDSCISKKRLFCQICAKQIHKKHRIGRIDRLIEPLSLLSINSHHEDSAQIYEQIKTKLEQFQQVLNVLKVSVQNTIEQIKRTTFFQIQCILETFSEKKIEQVEENFYFAHSKQDDIQQSIATINFLQFQGVDEAYEMKTVCDQTINKMSKALLKTSQKIDIIFSKTLRHIKQNDFFYQLRKHKQRCKKQSEAVFSQLGPRTAIKTQQQTDLQLPPKIQKSGFKPLSRLGQFRAYLQMSQQSESDN